MFWGPGGIRAHSTSNIERARATALLSLIGLDRKGSAPKMEKVTSDLTVKSLYRIYNMGFRAISTSNKEE